MFLFYQFLGGPKTWNFIKLFVLGIAEDACSYNKRFYKNLLKYKLNIDIAFKMY